MQDFFIAKQPIMDSKLNIVGYELLFRDSMKNAYPGICPDKATRKLIDGAFLSGDFHEELGKAPAFINFTEQSIIDGDPFLLDPKQVIVEILETCTPSDALLEACRKMHAKGYVVALDDFIYTPAWKRFFDYIGIIKIDLQTAEEEMLLCLNFALKSHPNIALLAEKVDSHDQFSEYLSKGFTYFQGYFFAKPQISKKKVLSGQQQIVLELVGLVSTPDYLVSDVTKLIGTDVNITCRLLAYVNSTRFNRIKKISTIKQALASLGQIELSRFVNMLFILEMNHDKSDELSRMALFRASFCESIVQEMDKKLSDIAFLTGMLSVLDAMFDRPIADAVKLFPVSDDIMQALLGQPGTLNTTLSLCVAYEAGAWDTVQYLASNSGLDRKVLILSAHRAAQWAKEFVPLQVKKPITSSKQTRHSHINRRNRSPVSY